MQDALILSAALLAYVLLTQIGRHKVSLLRMLPSLGLVGYFAWSFLADLTFTAPNLWTAGIGTALGLAVGGGLLATLAVERDRETGRAYTRAGAPYLLIWLVVLGGRLLFLWALEHVTWFGEDVGRFLMENRIEANAVAAFFVLMAMAMILCRNIGVYVRVARTPTPVTVG
ncbi:DUF1453 domain-containing protein [Amycolatopsis anabasis]|uniref:DUF1453 domain-containing protein n=1 Tax=Amycolatopsis anabasis TaxID=1840409 RepID=UPI00131A74F2|nr:DUF1453 domain-containing protein [Amycolatopsis anabasis]